MIIEGWISELEMQWILSYMPEDKGTIVETGSATGRLFAYLYEFKPQWKYVGVDAWDKEIVYLQKDYTKDYFDEDALDYKKRITQDRTNQQSTIILEDTSSASSKIEQTLNTFDNINNTKKLSFNDNWKNFRQFWVSQIKEKLAKGQPLSGHLNGRFSFEVKFMINSGFHLLNKLEKSPNPFK